MISYIVKVSFAPHTLLIIVPKKDGGVRLCLDFRALNSKVIDDRYPLPSIQHIFSQLGKSKIFNCLDMRQSYNEIPLSEDSMEKTAFSSPNGHWELTSMPFGLKTAPSYFQRIVNKVLTGLIGTSTQVYLDDIVVQGKNLDDHVYNLRKVLDRLREAKLKLRLKKCEFFKEEVEYLGHIVGAQGLKPQDSKVEAIKRVPVPKTVKKLQAFLGLMNYYRKFISRFSEIAGPLNTLLKGKKGPHKKNDCSPLEWNENAQRAFEELKKEMSEKVVLQFPNFEKDFLLTTDASGTSIGGVLQQLDDNGAARPLTFFSRSLNQAERKYSAVEREALGVIYGLQVNRPLVLGYKVKIQTDHRPLVWLLKIATPNSRIARWQTLLSEYDFEVSHIPGRHNTVADFLSRMKQERETEFESPNDCDLIVGGVLQIGRGVLQIGRGDNDENEENIIDWDVQEIARKQDEVESFRKVKEMLANGETVARMEEEFRKLKLPKLPFSELQIEEGYLYKSVTSP